MRVALSSTTRRVLAAAIVLVIGTYFVLSPGDEARARQTLSRIAELVSEPTPGKDAEIRRQLGELVSSELNVDVPDAVTASGRERSLDATLALLSGSKAMIVLENVELRRVDATHFDASFDARLSSQAGDLHADIRHVRAVLEKSGSAWQLSSLKSSAKDAREPEARP